MVVTVASLSACTVFPDIKPHVISLKTGMCGRYLVVKKDPIEFKFDKWLPIEDCEGYFAVSPEDVAAVRAWYDATYSQKTK